MLFNKYLVLMKTVASEEIYKEGPTKVGDVVCETYERTDRQTDRRRDRHAHRNNPLCCWYQSDKSSNYEAFRSRSPLQTEGRFFHRQLD